MPPEPPGAPPPLDATQGSATPDFAYAVGRVVVGVGALIVVPAILTLRTVKVPIVATTVGDPTPYGYTWSLLFYLFPAGRLLYWFYFESAETRGQPAHPNRRAFKWTLGLLVPIAFFLDLTFGDLFFRFPNKAATLQWYLPGFSFSDFGFHRTLPIEEFVFYLSGFVAILLVYIWANNDWVPRYGLTDRDGGSLPQSYAIQLHWASLWWALLALAGAVAYKKLLADAEDRAGFPLYLTFLLISAVLPGLVLFRSIKACVNWRAFSITFLWVLLTSLLWESTLASPYGWWRYNDRWMTGLNVNAWADLPIEAVLLWLAVTFTTVVVYEFCKVVMRRNRSHLR